jgi:hypothetical protein
VAELFLEKQASPEKPGTPEEGSLRDHQSRQGQRGDDNRSYDEFVWGGIPGVLVSIRVSAFLG